MPALLRKLLSAPGAARWLVPAVLAALLRLIDVNQGLICVMLPPKTGHSEFPAISMTQWP